jgi:hypothetical protein
MFLGKGFRLPIITQQRIFSLGLLLIATGLICNEWLLTALLSSDGILSPRSVIIIWVFDAVSVLIGVVLAFSRSFATLLNVFIGLGFTALLFFGVEQFFYHLNHPSVPAEAAAAPPQISFTGAYTHDFFQPDELLGYKPRTHARVDSVKKLGDELVYSVVYSIDAFGRRITPAENLDRRNRFILFFGDSFVFGEGVQDHETLPFYVSEMAPSYRVYNYGFSGYGPQQMLAKLQSDDLAQEVAATEGLVIYVFIDAHVERAIGSMYVYNTWGDRMPYYVSDWQGNLVRKGNFTTGRPLLSTLYWGLGQSEFAKYYQINIPRLTSSHYYRTAQIIAAARNTFQAKYHSDDFYVVIYPDEGDYVEDMIPHFEQFGLKYLNYDERVKLNIDEGLAIKGDGHPTGKAHRLVAGWIAADLDLPTD